MKNQTRALGRPEKAVYDLIRTHALPMDAILALYRREVSALASAGLVERTAAGLYCPGENRPDTNVATMPPPAPREVLENLNVRVPRTVHDAIDHIAGAPGRKSDVVRAILAAALPVLVDAGTANADTVHDVLRAALGRPGSGLRKTGS